MKIVFLVFLSLSSMLSFSQEFLVPYEGGIPPSLNCYAITTQGDSITGKAVFGWGTARGIRTMTIVTDAGEKIKFNASELSRFGFKNNGLVKTISVVERSVSLKKINTTNWKQIFNREYIVYERVLLPSGKRYVLMQKLNPGFDSKIKVFYSNGSRKTSGIGLPALPTVSVGPIRGNRIMLTGDMQRVYWISKNNGNVFKVKKGRYNKKKFKSIFGDVPEMLETFHRPYRLKNFPEHVFFYDQLSNR
jgi:hypothetical protein